MSLTVKDLARTIWDASRADEGTISATGADIIARALLPLVANAWDEGYTSGHSNAMRLMSDEPYAPATLNPYRAALTKEPDQ